MLLSLVIPSLNTKGHLENMLSSLATHRPTQPHEVIVVDMSSTDGTVQMVESRYPEVRLLKNLPNKGYGAAANAGMAVAQGTHIFVCNSDLVFREGNIDHIAQTLGEVGDDTLLGFKLVGLDGVMQRSALGFPGRFHLVWMFSTKVRRSWELTVRLNNYLPDWNFTQTTAVDWVTGAALAASRKLFDRLRGFDEQFFLFSEEVDLCRRLHDLGGRVLYVPEVELTHVGGGTLPDGDLRWRWLAAGRVRYTRKHYGRMILLLARLGATLAYLSNYPLWAWGRLRGTMSAAKARAEIKLWSAALLEAWRT